MFFVILYILIIICLIIIAVILSINKKFSSKVIGNIDKENIALNVDLENSKVSKTDYYLSDKEYNSFIRSSYNSRKNNSPITNTPFHILSQQGADMVNKESFHIKAERCDFREI